MRNATEFYQNSIKGNKISPLLRTFFRLKLYDNQPEKTAIDIGCGAGNDTICLLDRGFKVTAIDNEPQVKELIYNRTDDKENLQIIIDDFSKLQLPKADLILANNSIFFVKENFDTTLKNILRIINENGYFVGNFLGNEDDWKEEKTTMEKDEVLSYFTNFKLIYFSEEKYYKSTIEEKNKFWHVYNIIAKKK